MKYLYVANWKMNLSYRKSLDFCTQNLAHLNLLSKSAKIIICPSLVALAPIIEIFKNSAIKIGAQNCSAYKAGSYTGEVSAQDLKEAGASYCIIGHSERRIYFGETTQDILTKIELLYTNNIMPIICIGETQEDFLHKKTIAALQQQLEPILTKIIQQKYEHVIIAYEPFWAIGTGIIPEDTYLEEIFRWLKNHVSNHKAHLLYGGSINTTNINQLKTIEHIDGFLIGGASTDFGEFKNLIENQD
jgi:triosephosphate isomerase (TIM)